MTTTDANNIIRYEDTDPITPIQTILNLGMQSVSDALTPVKNGSIQYVANEAARNALAAIFLPTPSKPLYVYRGDAPDGLSLEWTTDGTTYHNVSTWLPAWSIERYRSVVSGAGAALAGVAFNRTRRYNAGAVPANWGLTSWDQDVSALTLPATGWYSYRASIRIDTSPSGIALTVRAGTEVQPTTNLTNNNYILSSGIFYGEAGQATEAMFYASAGTTIQPDNASDGNVRTVFSLRYMGA